MLNKRIIPCLLLSNGKLVKTIEFSNSRLISEPIYAVKIFNDCEADELIILDIEASRNIKKGLTNIIPYELISKISDESWMPLTYGGGITSKEEIKKIINMGIEKVCISSYAIHHPEFIKDAASEFGRQSIVVSIDYRLTESGLKVFTHGGLYEADIDPLSCSKMIQEAGAGEIILHNIERDGTYQGYDIEVIREIASHLNIPVIALGGAGCPSDLRKGLCQGGASAVAAGSMFIYFGKKRAVLINYPDVIEKNQILLT
jgi:cyclase